MNMLTVIGLWVACFAVMAHAVKDDDYLLWQIFLGIKYGKGRVKVALIFFLSPLILLTAITLVVKDGIKAIQ